MQKHRLISFAIVACAFLFFGCDDSNDIPGRMSYTNGDSLHWIQPDYDDSHWQSSDEDPDLSGDYFWIRWFVPLDKTKGKEIKQLGLWLAATSPLEIYCNGEYVGTNTVDKKPIEENQAYAHQIYRLPLPEKGATEILLAIRIYAKTYPPVLIDYDLDAYSDILGRVRTQELDQLIFAIIYIVIAAFYIFYYLGGESGRSSLLFIALLLLIAYVTLSNFILTYFALPLTPFFAIVISDMLIMYIISILSMAFFMYQFDYPKKWHLWLWALLSFCITLFNPSDFSTLMALISCFSMSIWAFIKKRDGALPALIGSLICLSSGIIDLTFNQEIVDFGFLCLILALNMHLLMQIRQRRADHQSSLLRSARLEAQLLRKSIQPHYVLNSMNAVMDWIETEPDKGIEFLGALAEEFQVLSRISHKKEISVAEEIKICEAHLKIMSCRKEIEYSLATSNILSEEKIPPAIFHTLIENGVKYGGINGSGVDFKIDRKQLPNGRSYSIFNSGAGISNGKNKPDGTGMRYIKSRLEESYGQDWKLESHYRDDGYECLIDIYDGDPV